MVSQAELDILARFDADGGTALSLYLDVSTPGLREGALDRAREHITSAAGLDAANLLESLSEDLDMVELYLSTSSARTLRYVAIFSCARQLFWRAHPLGFLINESVSVSSQFDVAPLREHVIVTRPIAPVPVLVRDLLPQG